ncbi:MAG: hypothetical protein WCE54_17200 [Ignavibacteriaceae bacterium]
MSNDIIEWLLTGDPSIRWQALADLINADRKSVEKERVRITKEGWGAKLLSFQDKEGTWAQSLYSRKWISTTYSMLLLRRLGLPKNNKQALSACDILWEKGIYKDGGINYSASYSYSEICVTGIILSILSYFGFEETYLKKLTGHLLSRQMEDGGWNCRAYKGDKHSSFHTTINVLEGLREYEKNCPGDSFDIEGSRNKAVEFLLKHKLYKSHRTGKIFDQKMTRFSFPPRWHYDIMRILDFFRECKIPKDERINDAVNIILKKRNEKGLWPLQQRHPGKTFFEMESPGKPSRWNTLRGMRILNWWEG